MMTNVLEPETNVDLGVLIGLLLTDGSVSFKKSRNATINLTCKSTELHDIFKEKLIKLFRIRKFSEGFDKRFPEIKTTAISSKVVANELTKFTPTFRTKVFEDGTFPSATIPEFIFNLKNHEIAKILQVMFSADGSVCLGVKWNITKNTWQFTRRIKFSSKHPALKQQMTKLLKNFGLGPKIWKKEVVLERKSDIETFAKQIGFVQGVKVTKDSKNWCGFEKNQILNLAVKSLEIRETSLRIFKTKQEVIHFLKKMVPT